jgi:acetyl-CoA C-acetyltransferase
MAEGIKDKVAIIGMGCTKFGERFDAGPQDLVVESFMECLGDAGIEKKEIQAAWWGCHMPDLSVGRGAPALGTILKLPYIPITRVENFCATGSEALRGAVYAVASGACDICLAIGMEKLKDTGFGGLPITGGAGPKFPLIGGNMSAPGGFAMMATKYFSQYNLSPQDGKMMLAKVSAKSHKNGALNPKAHLRKEVSVEQIMNAPIIAWPLGLFDCCGVSDGSAAAIVCRADMAKKFRTDPVFVKSIQISATSGEEQLHDTWDGSHVETAYRAGIAAYKEAGIKNPREEVSMAEVHDCFSITEATAMEDLQFSPRGKVKEDIDAGRFNSDGAQPIQIDGGLKCFGHPIGASGLRMMYEMYKQLQGKADKRQLKNPKIGLTHNMGGFPYQSVVSVCIVGK